MEHSAKKQKNLMGVGIIFGEIDGIKDGDWFESRK
jgi:hypothetical protein